MSSVGVTKLSFVHNKVDYKETTSSVFSYCAESVTSFIKEANSRPELQERLLSSCLWMPHYDSFMAFDFSGKKEFQFFWHH